MASTAEIAARHGFSEGAARAVLEALRHSGGRMAQFSHPELGGMGQWSQGGMLMIGAMFDDALKARVRALVEELAAQGHLAPEQAAPVEKWPDALGQPGARGSQNGLRYAVFPETRRLWIERDGVAELYDTGAHRIGGVSQAQGGTATIRFSGPDGEVKLTDLRRVLPAG
ncbi:MAG: hypothetical protein DI629_04685 [Mesorhizobium amorphae]|nr:MAG: hypothetical protein DI629_04685 [Mesorhizobium amorphae]